MILRLSNIIVLLFILVPGNCFAQNQQKIDSLKKVIFISKEDTNKVEAYIALSKQFKRNNSDSCIFYSKKGLDLSAKINYLKGLANCYYSIGYSYSRLANYKSALENYNKSIEYAGKINDKQGLAACYNNIGLLKEEQSEYNDAIDYFNKALKIDIELKDTLSVAGDYNNIGMIYWNLGNYSKSLDYHLRSLKLKEKTGNKLSVAISYINIGLVHKDMLSYDQALKYYYNALIIYKELGNKSGIANCHHNIAGVQFMQKKYKEAKENYLIALQLNIEINDINRIGDCYNNLGNLAFYEKKYSESIQYYNKSLKIDEELDNKKNMAICLGNISSIKVIEGKYNEAIGMAQKALDISKEIGALPIELECYQHLSSAYESLNDYKNAYIYHKLYKFINDSIYNQESSKQVKQMEAKYQSEKKQLEIDNLNKDKALRESEIANKREVSQKQRYLIYFIIFGLFVIIIFSILTFRQYIEKKKTNHLLNIQHQEIQQKNEEISAQRDEIESQRDIVVKQKEKITDIHEKVTSSIRYAKRIQTAVLPGYDITNMLLPEHFILFKPRDIVSGDFYWTMIKKNWIYIAVADCTGHGVPGAFMSMLGISFLNEIIAHNEFVSASHILDKLREQVILSLKQKSMTGNYSKSDITITENSMQNVNDGMDISLIAINLEDYYLQYAGANNPCWIINPTPGQPDFIELKADKMPIAIYPDIVPFTNTVVQLTNSSRIYLFSDGFADQFGGPEGKKFMRKKLKDLILKNHTESMEKQSEVYNDTITQWIASNGKINNQTDDITLFGMKISI